MKLYVARLGHQLIVHSEPSNIHREPSNTPRTVYTVSNAANRPLVNLIISLVAYLLPQEKDKIFDSIRPKCEGSRKSTKNNDYTAYTQPFETPWIDKRSIEIHHKTFDNNPITRVLSNNYKEDVQIHTDVSTGPKDADGITTTCFVNIFET